MTPLCDIAYKYRTDKCPQLGHNYTPSYYELFKDKRSSVKKVLEVGIGYPEEMRHVVKRYKTGASLYTWREFFPNAQIYGVDINSKAIFQDERIDTYLLDSKCKESLVDLINKIGSDIDLFVDDGDHNINSQLSLCKDIIPFLNKEVVYVIEDVKNVDILRKGLCDFNLEVLELDTSELNSNLVMIKKLK